MEAVARFFSEADLKVYLVAVLMVLVCSVPFMELFVDLWRFRFKKGD